MILWSFRTRQRVIQRVPVVGLWATRHETRARLNFPNQIQRETSREVHSDPNGTDLSAQPYVSSSQRTLGSRSFWGIAEEAKELDSSLRWNDKPKVSAIPL
jgi:hypothetical protein